MLGTILDVEIPDVEPTRCSSPSGTAIQSDTALLVPAIAPVANNDALTEADPMATAVSVPTPVNKPAVDAIPLIDVNRLPVALKDVSVELVP